jgi:myo-inositol-1(or 4)-monophosphatase
MSPSEPTPSLLLEAAVAAARAGGLHALGNLHRRSETIMVAAHDVKLRLDVECQDIAERTVKSFFPDHAILAEESANLEHPAEAPSGSPYLWIIDPIDGTVNFSHGLPLWCCSVAVKARGTVLAGAVFAPALNELYTAARGLPACCNGTPLRVSRTSALDKAMVLTGLDQKLTPRMNRFDLFRDIADHAQKARVLGAAALDVCRVAAGQADGYFESGIYTWDVAAAGLVAEQAGGRIEILGEPGPHRLYFLATNGFVHDALKALIQARLSA